MKFLLNMNLPRALGRLLAAAGHATRHVGDIGMARSADPAIVNEAMQQNEIIITLDLDYGDLLAFSGDVSPSVIISRLRNTHPDQLFARLMAILPEVEKNLNEGAIVVVDDVSVRVRTLPIGRDY